MRRPATAASESDRRFSAYINASGRPMPRVTDDAENSARRPARAPRKPAWPKYASRRSTAVARRRASWSRYARLWAEPRYPLRTVAVGRIATVPTAEAEARESNGVRRVLYPSPRRTAKPTSATSSHSYTPIFFSAAARRASLRKPTHNSGAIALLRPRKSRRAQYVFAEVPYFGLGGSGSNTYHALGPPHHHYHPAT